MKGIREIKSRKQSVDNTAKITKAMQLVAASKMKRAQDTAKASRDYALLLAEILGSLIHEAKGLSHPLIDRREIKKKGILLITTDKGLCGPLNSNLFRLIGELKGAHRFVCVGRKGAQFIARTKRDLMAEFSVSDHCKFSEVRPIMRYLVDEYLKGEIDTVDVVYPRFLTTLTQEACISSLLPLEGLEKELEQMRRRLGKVDYTPLHDDREMTFEPSAKRILAELPEMFIKQEVYQMILETKASEHSARMVAMKTATDNANELSKELKLEYNRVRQAAITQEILEIAAAAASSANNA